MVAHTDCMANTFSIFCLTSLHFFATHTHTPSYPNSIFFSFYMSSQFRSRLAVSQPTVQNKKPQVQLFLTLSLSLSLAHILVLSPIKDYVKLKRAARTRLQCNGGGRCEDQRPLGKPFGKSLRPPSVQLNCCYSQVYPHSQTARRSSSNPHVSR